MSYLRGDLEELTTSSRLKAFRSPASGFWRQGDMRFLRGMDDSTSDAMGLSLRPPKWARKLTIKKVLPYAAVAGALLIPGVAPTALALAKSAGSAVSKAGRGVIRIFKPVVPPLRAPGRGTPPIAPSPPIQAPAAEFPAPMPQTTSYPMPVDQSSSGSDMRVASANGDQAPAAGGFPVLPIAIGVALVAAAAMMGKRRSSPGRA